MIAIKTDIEIIVNKKRDMVIIVCLSIYTPIGLKVTLGDIVSLLN